MHGRSSLRMSNEEGVELLGCASAINTTVLLPNHKLRGTQVSCPTLRKRRRTVRIGEVLAVVLELQLIDTEGRGHALGCISIRQHKM